MAANRKYYQDYEELCELLEKSSGDYDMEKIDRAYRLAEKMHGDQRRIEEIKKTSKQGFVHIAQIKPCFFFDICAVFILEK